MRSEHPYPGLRPFRRDETDIFFGREEQTDELLTRLEHSSFLAVVGPSGCGKSSLVKAGMIAGLETGFMASAGARWRMAEMRPGNHPLRRLAAALTEETALREERGHDPDDVAFLLATLRRGPLGLAEVLRETPLPPHTNLLVLVDQFEEIFRYQREGDAEEAGAFVKLLLETARQEDLPVYVVLTMRSDFLGRCALFRDLPEAMNDSQYLTPRLTREQRQASIVGPARVFGGNVDPALVNHILNEVSADPDQLPIMQHLMMRMWSLAGGDGGAHGPTLTLDHYEKAGGLKHALSQHANEAFNELDPKPTFRGGRSRRRR
jgi:energy-coupling factor transporter ATP-binding protein EcfA2